MLPAGEVRDLWNRLAGIIESDMEELAELDLARRLQEADSKAGWEGPEQQYSGGDAVRDYEGEPIEYHPSSDDDMRPRGS